MKALIAGDREAFYASEIGSRERTGYPPFGRLASLIISGGRSAHRRRVCAAGLPRSHRSMNGSRCWAPAEAPLAVIKGR